MKSKLPLLLLAISLLAGCKKDDENPTVPSGLIYTYYPDNVGHEMIYNVSLITKDEFTGAHDTSIYQLKEVIESIFSDNQGRATQRLERYRRDTPSDPWVILDVWTANLTNDHVERKEENITYVKMVFPILSSITWNGNVYNSLGDMTYSYEDLHIPTTVSSMTFDSTLVVLHEDEDNFIEKKYSVEQFANHVGLIYKEDTYIEKDYTIPSQPGIKSQRLYKQTLISYTN